MLDRFSGSMITIAIAASAQAPGVSAAAPAPAVKTPWGEPDLQGIWTDENDTPFQRSPKYADQEFFTEALIRHSAVNAVRPRGGKYDPTPTSHGAWHPRRYNTARMNRHADVEDGALADRCLTPGLPEFGATNGGRSFRRIVQTPGGISIAYDVGQGQGWQRNIVMNGSPHVPANIRQWYGDSRGHWEGNTLVIDVTNFSPKTEYRGSRENLHLVERWDADRASHARIRRDHRRPDRVGASLDRQAGVHQAERAGEPDLLRASLRRRKYRLPYADEGGAPGRPRVRRETRAGSADQGQRIRRG
jgi:hypothetical protein